MCEGYCFLPIWLPISVCLLVSPYVSVPLSQLAYICASPVSFLASSLSVSCLSVHLPISLFPYLTSVDL